MPSSLTNRKRSFKQRSFCPLRKSEEKGYDTSTYSDQPHANPKKAKHTSEFANTSSAKLPKKDIPTKSTNAAGCEFRAEERDDISNSPAPQLERQDLSEVEKPLDIFDDSGIEEPIYPDMDYIFEKKTEIEVDTKTGTDTETGTAAETMAETAIPIAPILNHDSVQSAFLPYQLYFETMNNERQRLLKAQMPDYIFLYTPTNVHPTTNPPVTRFPVFSNSYKTL